MILKPRDASRERVFALEKAAANTPDETKRASLRQAAARLKADKTSEKACQHIDHYFRDSPHWGVLHDVRLSCGRQLVHINHLLINGALECYVIDSRYINRGIDVSPTGVCRVFDNTRHRLIGSPLHKLARDTRILAEWLKTSGSIPRREKWVRPVSVKGFVLTSPSLRCQIDEDQKSETIISADSLFPLVWKEPEHWFSRHVGLVCQETLCAIGAAISAAHVPSVPQEFMDLHDVSAGAAAATEAPLTQPCGSCNAPADAAAIASSFKNMELFSGKILCHSCQKERWQAGSAAAYSRVPQ